MLAMQINFLSDNPQRQRHFLYYLAEALSATGLVAGKRAFPLKQKSIRTAIFGCWRIEGQANSHGNGNAKRKHTVCTRLCCIKLQLFWNTWVTGRKQL